MRTKIFSVLIASSLAVASLSAGAWTITDLGAYTPLAINNNGDVAGTFNNGSGYSAFLYQDGKVTDLSSLPGGTNATTAYGINDHGQVVGTISIPSGARFGGSHAFVYNKGTFTNLSAGETSTRNWAVDINNSGQVIGISNANPNFDQLGFLQDGSTRISLALPGHHHSEANAINNKGEVVGTSYSPLGDRHAYLYSGGEIKSIGNFWAMDISESGLIAGYSRNADNHERALIYANGKITEVGGADSKSASQARAVNSRGDVVGTITTLTESGLNPRAFLYTNGQSIDLNSLSEVQASGWQLGSAFDINDLGQIVGIGSFNGEVRGFILSSMAAPEIDGANGMLGLAILGGLLSLMRRKPSASA